jgi:GTP cyclohydrolase II
MTLGFARAMTPPFGPDGLPAEAPAVTMRSVDRAVADLRRGDPVVIADERGSILILAAETAGPDALARLVRLGGGAPAAVALAPRRALGLGLEASDAPVIVTPTAQLTPDLARSFADPTATQPASDAIRALAAARPDGVEAAAVALTKIARLLPAAILVPLAAPREGLDTWARMQDILVVSAVAVVDYRRAAARLLRKVSEAKVPLAAATQARLVAFRPADGGLEHFAIVIGDPDTDGPVLTRIHSECFTGDLLGSLRCDCGEQLRGAIGSIDAAGGGVLLYMAQEGRGIGLVNKLRAYQLQDAGLDTVDANEALGFDADERVYLPAAEMLRQLGVRQVRLMTNNPDKVDQLSRWGVPVAERVPHIFPGNGHNEQYLRTKAERSGHMF